MKDTILQIVEEALKHPTLLENTTYSLTVNYITERGNPVFNKSAYNKIKKKLNERGSVLSYNFTITMKVPGEIDWESKPPDNWRSVNFIFHGNSKDHNIIDFNYNGDNAISSPLFLKFSKFIDDRSPLITRQSYEMKDIQMVILFMIELYGSIYANSLRLNKTFDYFSKFFKDTVIEE